MISQKHALAGAVITLFLGAVTVLSVTTQTIYAQVLPTLHKTNSTITAAKNRFSPFQGQTIKIFNVYDFSNQKVWQPIDNYTSHGYEIKAIIPREDTTGRVTSFTVVLEARH